jgi:hypothetical protein
LVDCALKIELFVLDLNEDLIDEKSISVSLVPSSKPLGVSGSKLDVPQSNRFVTDHDSSFGHEIFDVTGIQIEAVIEPDCVLNDLRRETVTFIFDVGLSIPRLSFRHA